MKRYLPLIGIIAVVLVLAIIFFARPKDEPSPIPNGSTSSSSAPSLKAVLTSVSGTVTVTPQNGSPSPAIEGQAIKTDDEIKTGQGGQVTIEFYASSRLALDANTTVVIDQAFIDDKDWRKQQVKVRLTFGRVWSRILKLLDPQASYDVTYNGVVSGVRGTAFMLTTRTEGSIDSLTIDQFDDSLHISGKTDGTLREGFSAFMDTNNPPPDLAANTFFMSDDVRNDHWVAATLFTSDQVRNDPWVRMQLKADEDFAKRAIDIRRSLGTNETVGTIGQEAGPYTIQPDGSGHSNFRTVEVSAPNQARTVTAGSRTQLIALAVFEEPSGRMTKDVSSEATWQISNASRSTIDDAGRLTVDLNAPGAISVTARWNDGTHEHSGTATFIIIPR